MDSRYCTFSFNSWRKSEGSSQLKKWTFLLYPNMVRRNAQLATKILKLMFYKDIHSFKVNLHQEGLRLPQLLDRLNFAYRVKRAYLLYLLLSVFFLAAHRDLSLRL